MQGEGRGGVEKDEREEKGLRMILNYGHTVGHAIEAATGFEKYSHGEAVALGMIAAAKTSNKLGFLSKEDVERHTALIEKNRIAYNNFKNQYSESI